MINCLRKTVTLTDRLFLYQSPSRTSRLPWARSGHLLTSSFTGPRTYILTTHKSHPVKSEKQSLKSLIALP